MQSSTVKSSHMCDVMDEEVYSSIQCMRKTLSDIARLSLLKDKNGLSQYCKKNNKIINQLLGFCTDESNKNQNLFKSQVSPYMSVVK